MMQRKPGTETGRSLLNKIGPPTFQITLDALTARDLVLAIEDEARDDLLAVAKIVRRHTHQDGWAMTCHAGEAPTEDCLLCRSLVGAGVLALDQIGAGTRAAIIAEMPE